MGVIDNITVKLFDYCKKHQWAGYDPYDALNSRVFASTPLRHSKMCRIALIQGMKRLPLNLRPLLLIEKEQNPKAIALFLMACLKMSKHGFPDVAEDVRTMVSTLDKLRSTNSRYWCWGYSFPWQTRTILVPKGAPNLVSTVFAANALLDVYEADGDDYCLCMATSAAEYLLDELYWTEGESVAGFCYPLPELRSRVHNAHFLGASLFCRVYSHTGENKFLDAALKVTRYSAGKQKEDGSWDYGEGSKQRWVDNFHTGYNLCALRSIGQNVKASEFEPHLRRGFDFYRSHFFREDGAPRYFHDRTYPIDIHSVAQSIITLLELEDLDAGARELAYSVFDWAMGNMRDKEGYFYYQVRPFYKNTIPYMRWSQAWMLLALSSLLKEGRLETAVESNTE